jgi:acyl-CoA thioester hydrolase
MSDYRFFHPIEVRYGDLDPQGHVNNARYLTYMEQARVRYWNQLGLFANLRSFEDMGVIIADIHIQYKKPVHWGLPLKVGVQTTRIGGKSLTVGQCVIGGSGQEVFALGEVVLVAYDYGNQSTVPVPDAWREKLERFEGHALG